jgi:glutathione S-transferase
MKGTRRRLEGHELFYFSTCPYCIRVRLALRRLKLEIPLKNILTHPEYNSELLAGGGEAQVPCLRIENEQGEVRWMYESGDIVRYLERQSGNFA